MFPPARPSARIISNLALTPGTRLGVYEVAAQIGEGGMGQVYRATDTKLKREVAIKILSPSFAADHDRLARFQREAEVLASLNHPHIAAIYGLEDADGAKALVLELVEGDDLSQRLARGPIPLDVVLPIAKQIAEALHAAHQASDGTGVAEQLTWNTTSADKAPTGVSPDGAWVIVRDGEPQGFDISRVALGKDHRIEPLVDTSFSEQNGEVSPDGRWLVYQSNDSGRAEIWVRPFADVNGGRWQVSSGGGFQPLWGPDSREMFYRDLTGAVMRVALERGPGWSAGPPTKLFGAGQYYFGYGEAFGRTYDISRDGRRFLMIKDVALDQSSAPSILVVQNWLEELKARVPTK